MYPEIFALCLDIPDVIHRDFHKSVIDFNEEGVAMLEDSIICTKSFAEANPNTVKSFLYASMKGWAYACENTAEAAQICVTAGASSLDHQKYMAEQIATSHGVRTINVLTGFKYIGEQIALLEAKGKERSYILGFEESYGYLTGSYVRDKDAVNASLMICEMFAYYKTRGISLMDKLNSLYQKFGYCLNKVYSYEFAGSAGFAKMAEIIGVFRNGNMTAFGGKKIVKCLDYSLGLDGLPKSNVLKFILEDNCSVVVRPSGTEPKLKTYLTITAASKEEAQALCDRVAFMNKGSLNDINTPAGYIEGLGNYAVDEMIQEELVSHFFDTKDKAIDYLQRTENKASLRETTLEDVFVQNMSQGKEGKE